MELDMLQIVVALIAGLSISQGHPENLYMN